MTRRLFFFIMGLLFSVVTWGQESSSVFNFLSLPTSAHSMALGGRNISTIEDDASLIFQNPAQMANVSSNSINLNFMTYMRGSKTGSAAFVRAQGERGTWGVTTQFVGYGKMKETLETGEVIGDMRALDMALCGMYCYNLNDRWVGGATGKFIYSKLAGYSSIGLAVDLGLNYYDEDHYLSIGAVARNLGGQLKAYDDDFERLPLDIQLGISKRLASSPLRFSATLVRLNDWEYGIGKHLVIGADILLSDQFYVAVGYNPLRASEMKITANDGEESNHGAALSFGAGMKLNRLQLHLAYGKYHVSSTSLMINFAYIL